MRSERLSLGNGIYLNFINTDKFKTNYISLDFIAKINESSAAENALLPFVLVNGTEKYPSTALLTKALDMLYGSHISAHVSKFGDFQYFGFSSYPLRSEYTDSEDISLAVLEIMSELINSPYLENRALSKSYVEREKKIMTDRVKAKKNDKGSYAVARCREIMEKGLPCIIPETGTEEQISEITEQSLTAALVRARSEMQCEIYCVGSFDREKTVSAVKKMFSCRLCEDIDILGIEKHEYLHPESVKEVTEDEPITQGKLCLGFRTDTYITDSNYLAFVLLCEVLSGSPTAKLFMNVREKHSLCYYCTAIPEFFSGFTVIASGIDNEMKDKTVSAVLSEIDDCKSGRISENEINAAVRSIKNSLLSIEDDAGEMKSWYFRRIAAGCDAVSPSELSNMISEITKNDIISAAQKLKLNTVYFLKGTAEGEEDGGEYQDE